MKEIVANPAFLKDWKKLEKKHYDKQALLTVVQLLGSDYIPAKYHDHALVGDMQGYRECHIEKNQLLIYQITETEIILVATGSHDDLFK